MKELKQVVLQRKSVAIQWLISYFLLLAVPLIASISVYVVMEKTLETQIERFNQLMLSQTQKELDNIFNAQNKICTEMAFNTGIKGLLNINDATQRWENEMKTVDYLHSLFARDAGFVDTVFVYFYETDTVITQETVMDSKSFYNRHYDWGKDGFERWKNFMRQEGNGKYTRIRTKENGENENEIIFMLRLPLTALYGIEPRATAAVIVKEEHILELSENIREVNGGEITILNEENKVFLSGSEEMAKLLLADKQSGSRGDVIHSYAKSDVTPWKYVISVRKSEYWSSLLLIRILLVFYVIFTVIFGVILSRRFVRKNYAPVERLMDKLKTCQDDELSEYDEFSIIFNEISKVMSERDHVSGDLKNKRAILRRSFFVQLFNGTIKSREMAEEYGKEIGITFGSDIFAVALFNFDDVESLFADETDLDYEDRRKYYQLIISNVMEEILGDFYDCYSCEMENRMAVLVSVPPNKQEDAVEDIVRTLKEGISLIEKHFGIQVNAVVSDTRESTERIAECYYEACDAIRVLQSTKIYGVVKCVDVLGEPYLQWYGWSEQEVYLTSYIKSGASERAKNVICEYFRKQNEFGERVELLRCMMFNLLHVMFRTVEEEENGNIDFSKEECLERLLRCDSAAKMQELMQETAEKLCSYKAEETRRNTMSIKIKQMVQNNFRENGFGVMEIGEHFHLTPAYVSGIFKNETGELLSDYIMRVRIEEAKRLIRETDDTLENIAHRVGYLNAKILSRTFKKREGILPSQYREKIKGKK